MKYSKVNFGQAEAVFNKLGGEQGIMDFLSGRTQVVKLNTNFPTFMTIKVDAENCYDLIKMIKKEKTIDTKESNNVLDWPMFGLQEEKEVELVVVTPKELGFESMFESCATYENICERAEKLGLDECPSTLGMQLALPRYGIKDGFYVIASKLLEDEKRKKHLLVPWFGQKGCELKAWEVDKDKVFFKDFKFIFVRKNVVLEG
jgi:uncharacterized protein YlaN (UPF0358 family)